MTHRQETPATATSRPQGAEQPADDTQDAATRDRPSDARTEELARALAGAEHINHQRDTGPWDDLTPQQQDWFRAEAARATGKETS
ncbi:hypothetical protein AB0G60_02955 [Streptomyces angustmyceticus]|uniref:Uncharacterized protein n=1 Tax=Streptomyces angustmyceticus TaxID=285578 RepID=A0A5J4L0C9_9ACTN|nr:hypothetical protein [Streptomyces angustmyceticus]UAL65621.1 hypothetical protein K7396_02920 [Streptomyces angustmyceticus]GES27857.1 hypothetical protein San01_03440 [Streptomyces angustmyceticus]